MKKLLTILLVAALMLSTCTVFALTDVSAEMASIDVSEYFTDRDLSGDWDEVSAKALDLSQETGTAEITQAGTYVLSGTLAGSIHVNVGSDDKVQLVLNGASVTANGTAALYVESADKVFVTLAEGTENALISTAFEDGSDIDGAVFAKDDIVFNGSGTLTVTSANHGIVGKDDLKITGGTYVITAEGRGIDANDSIRIYDGSFTIVSGKDAVRVKSDEADKGYLLVVNGTFDVTAGGGAQNGEAHTEERMGFGRGGWGNTNTAASTESSASTKGFKASGSMLLLGGAFTVDTADDAFHTDSDLTVYGGTFAVRSGDDGMHANNALTIQDGAVTIAQSYEGLEATVITINGGNISVAASDDGLNAAGGNDQSGYFMYDMFASDGVSGIVINGGSVYVSSQGDGLDSNGDLTISGGTVVVSGPTNSGNGALDYNGNGVITGGTIIAAGASGMSQNFSSASTQAAALVNLSGSAGDTITVSDASGKVLLTGTVEKSFQCVVISCPDLQVGETYTVSTGSGSAQVTLSSVITGGGAGFGMGGGRQQMQGGFDGQRPDKNQIPDGQTPNGQQPGGQMPNGQQPGGQRPGGPGRHGW